jgi:hypothetical protein
MLKDTKVEIVQLGDHHPRDLERRYARCNRPHSLDVPSLREST